MRKIPAWRRYLRLLGRDERGDVEDELAFHLEAKRDELIGRGLPPERAAVEARREFGDVAELRELCVRIEQDRTRKMDWRDRIGTWRQDVRYAARQLRRSPGFTAAAVVSLALGIGANTAVFTLTDQLLLRLLPVEKPRELVQLRVDGGRAGSQSGDGVHTFSHPAYLALRDQNTVFSGLTGESIERAGLTVNGRSEMVKIALAAGNYFEVLGVKAHRGRLLTPQDDRVRLGGPVAVLRYEFWMSQFGGDPAAVGSTIRLTGYPFTVVGVAAPGFDGTDMASPTNVWIPVTMRPAVIVNDRLEDPLFAWFSLFGRLKPGVRMEQAEAAMRVTYRQRQDEELRGGYFARYPGEAELLRKQTFRLEPAARGQSWMRVSLARPLVLLELLVGAVLLIACSNIAGLLLARGAARERELAIRTAMGAGRGALIRQLMVESLLLAGLSGAAGILFGGWATGQLVRLVASGSPTVVLRATPDLRVLLFTAAITIVTALLFGLLPAWQASRPAAVTLKESAGSLAGGKAQARLRKCFVAVQVGLSTLLLIGAGLFARTLGNLRNIELGFDTRHVATFGVNPASAFDDGRKLLVYRQLIESLATVPGVKAVGANTSRLLAGSVSNGSIRLPGAAASSGEPPESYFNQITPGYFEALGIPIQGGRNVTWSDWGGSRKYCLVNAALVKKYLNGRNPVGTSMGRGAPDAPLDFEIAGVFGNAHYEDPRGAIPPQTFFAMDGRIHFVAGVNVYARVEGDPRAMLPALREQVRRVDPDLVVSSAMALDDQLNVQLANERMLAILSIGFAVLATLLAATGLYGVLSFLVARRGREIGIRMALGAERGRVIRLVLGEMAGPAVSGLAGGVAAAIAGGRWVESQLYGIRPSDPVVFGVSVAALAACALAAAAVPAWRASRLDPTTALRAD